MKHRILAAAMIVLTASGMACAADTASATGPASATGAPAAPNAAASDKRYVWATNLIVRAQADPKAAEVVRLPYGSEVTLVADSAPPVARHEVLLKLAQNGEWRATELALDGNWRHVKAQGGEGWAFDGYLSRYPAPHLAQDKKKDEDEDQVQYAKRIFGVKETFKWDAENGKKDANYRALLQHTKMTDKQTHEEVSWEFVAFKSGGSYEMLNNRPDGGMYSGNIDIKDLPLTYGEALLWFKSFGGLESVGGTNVNGVGKLSGEVKPGHHLQLGPAPDDDSGFGYGRKLDCTATTCSMNFAFSD